MLWGRVPPVVRLVVLGIPFVLVNLWLLSPYFVDDVITEEFSVSISSLLAAGATTDAAPAPAAAVEPANETAADGSASATAESDH